jgi:DNA polymerase
MNWKTAIRKATQYIVPEFARPIFRSKDVDWDRLVSIDFETFYDDDYTLLKLSTSEYVRDPRFKAQMLYLKVGRKPARIIPPNRIATELRKINWATHALLCHHTQFDGLILSHHYGVVPSFYYDTLSMARGLHSNEIGAGLDEVSMYYGGAGKVQGVLETTKGVLNWSPELFKRVTPYCQNDGDEMLRVFEEMIYALPEEEVDLINVIVRMFCDPVLEIDRPRVEAELAREVKERDELLTGIVNTAAYYEDKTVLKTKAERALVGKERDLLIAKRILGSNEKFAGLLLDESVDPPVKLSPAWMKKDKAAREADPEGKWTYAFAKDDIEFQNLPDVQERWQSIFDLNDTKQVKLAAEKSIRLRALVDARIAVKSTTNITRAERLLTASTNGMRLPAYYAYSRAHTHRLGGGDKRNLQNLKRGGELRRSIRAQKGHVLVVGDSGQIEARTNAWLWRQDDLLTIFRNKGDPYCDMASVVYGRIITKADATERFVGKVCVAGDTLVLTNHGVKSIVDVRSNDMLWDGTAWVLHDGLVRQGTKQVFRRHGFAATRDHEILTERGWQEWSAVLTDPSLFQSALNSATSPLYVGNTTFPETGNLGVTGLYADAPAVLKTWSMSAASKLAAALGAIHAPKSPPPLNATGPTNTQWPATSTVLGCSIDYRQQSLVVQTPTTLRTNITDCGAFQWLLNGVQIAQRFLSMFKLCLDGTIRRLNSTESTTAAITNRTISDFARRAPTCATAVKSKTWNSASATLSETTQTYDLANAGPNCRFTVLTEAGPLIIHNCVLGLGFQMGAKKLQMTLAKGALGGPPVFITLAEAERWVKLYRNKNRKIEAGWRICTGIIEDMAAGRTGAHGPINWEANKVWLPNGMCLHYPDLKKAVGDQGFEEWTYGSTLKGTPIRKKLYGGLLCLGAGTQVLTDNGWKSIVEVRSDDKVWDGTNWVEHSGVIYKGKKQTIDFGGVRITANHEVLVEETWLPAGCTSHSAATSSCERHYGAATRCADSSVPVGQQRKKNTVDTPVQLRNAHYPFSNRVSERPHKKLRMPNLFAHLLQHINPWHVQTSDVSRMAGHAGPVSTAYTSIMGAIRRAGHHSMRGVEFVRRVLGRHGLDLQTRSLSGSQRQHGGLFTQQLSLGHVQTEQPQHSCSSTYQYTYRADSVVAGVGNFGNQQLHSLLQAGRRMVSRTDVSPPEDVYDLVDAGPLRRFTVRGDDGRPFIVHNCENIVQALARIIVLYQLLELSKTYRVVMTTHDEGVLHVPKRQAEFAFQRMMKAMTTPLPWCEDLPLSAEGGYAEDYSK